MKISLDYDGTLSTNRGKLLLERLIKEGHTIYIITARRESDMGAVYRVGEELGIPKSRIISTEGMDKWRVMEEYGIKRHYDNNPEQIKKINDRTTTIGIKFNEENIDFELNMIKLIEILKK